MKRIIIALIGLCIMLSGYDTQAQVLGKYNIGFNEDFVAGYLQGKGITCTHCPGNSYSSSYSDINNLILDLAARQHVGAFREIIPLGLLEPVQGQQPYNSDIMSILSIYSTYNVNLTITVGLPIPYWMSVNGSDFNIMPDDDASWQILAGRIGASYTRLINDMWNNPNISRQWMSTRFYVEGFNEFDTVLNVGGSTSSSGPPRAAYLNNVIQYYLNQYGVAVQQTTPSIVGNYNRNRGQYLSDYYAYAGKGFPSVHVYAPADTPYTPYQAIVNAVSNEISTINNYLPYPYKNRIFLSETGNGSIEAPYCPAPNGNYGPGIDATQRASAYVGIASDPGINANVVMLTFWRLMRLSPQQVQGLPPCEGTYGVAPYSSSDGSYYNNVGLNLFYYLNH